MFRRTGASLVVPLTKSNLGNVAAEDRSLHATPSDQATPKRSTTEGSKILWLKPSRSQNRPPSIHIARKQPPTPSGDCNVTKAESAAKQMENGSNKGLIPVDMADLGPASPLFKITSPTCEYFAVRLPLIKGGFRRIRDLDSPLDCNIIWGKSLALNPTDKVQTHRLWHPYQKVNHFPGSHTHLGCKLGLANTLHRANESLRIDTTSSSSSTGISGGFQKVMPTTWRLPHDEATFSEEMARQEVGGSGGGTTTKLYIAKPARGSCGKGIRIFSAQDKTFIRQMLEQCKSPAEGLTGWMVVQEYIDNPMLHNKRKFDFRLYVAVTSYDPLTIYIHRDGLVRFAADEYSKGKEDSDLVSQVVDEDIPKPTVPVGIRAWRNADGTPKPGSPSNSAVAAAAGEKLNLHMLLPGASSEQLAQLEQFDRAVEDYKRRVSLKSYARKMNVNTFAHLTNYSIGRRLERHPEEDSTSTPENTPAPGDLNLKGRYTDLMKDLEVTYGAARVAEMQRAIDEVIVTTLLGAQGKIRSYVARERHMMTHSYRSSSSSDSHRRGKPDESSSISPYFETYGFDVMLDEAGKPWLIEVNTLPSFESSSAMDYEIKSDAMSDLLNLIQIPLFNRPTQRFLESAFEAPSTTSGGPSRADGMLPPELAYQAPNFVLQTSTPDKEKWLSEISPDSVLGGNSKAIDSLVQEEHNRLLDEDDFRGGFRRIYPQPEHREIREAMKSGPGGHFAQKSMSPKVFVEDAVWDAVYPK